ncbi:MAG: retropepsin-like aspartic protease [Thiobacillaceae bacterium]
MSSDHPPDLDHLFGRGFIRIGVVLGFVLIGYLLYKQATRPEMEVISAKEVRLQRQQDGHYHINGAINGRPVQFMLDTGASTVSVSQDVAKRAGLECEQIAVFVTANGKINGCLAPAKQITFGSYRLFDVDVAIMPNMDDLALLGMNALGRFDLHQTDRTLVITHKQVNQ